MVMGAARVRRAATGPVWTTSTGGETGPVHYLRDDSYRLVASIRRVHETHAQLTLHVGQGDAFTMACADERDAVRELQTRLRAIARDAGSLLRHLRA